MSDNSLLEKLEVFYIRFREIGQLITDPEVIQDMNRFVKLNKEYRELEQIVEAGDELKSAVKSYDEAQEILNTENDKELREMAEMEIEELEAKIPELETKIKMLLAPLNFSTPSIVAELPSTLTFAPILASSSRYLKRFSKILSVIVLVPLQSASVTPICGCISVGNPGYGSVFTCVLVRSPLDTTRTASSNSSTSQPISSSLAIVASKCFGMTFNTVTSPLVAAAANINVPASI